jgi:alkaline phosphatase
MHRIVPRNKVLSLIVTILLGLGLFPQSFGNPSARAASLPVPKYIFIFLADGAGITHLELARAYSEHTRGEGLAISDRIMKEGFVGFLTTHSADSLVTDSAAAATALASACKTKNGTVGICQDGTVPKTIMELAKKRGMRIGLVTNAAIYDASPAAFASHVPQRKRYRSIISQYLKLAPDLLLGGGRDQFLHQDHSSPGGNLLARFKENGYVYVSTKKALADVKASRVLGLFTPREMSFELRRDKNDEPSVYDMTEAAIRVLQKDNPKGFVAFIENENIDTAAHRADAVSLVHDFIEFDRAVGLAYKFYRGHPTETLLLVTSDHETGGLALIRKKGVLSLSASDESLSELVGPERARGVEISWNTSGHTNQPVSVTALGVGAERFRGYQDNTDFARHLFGLLQGN